MQVPTSYYDGSFKKMAPNKGSKLLKIDDRAAIPKIVNAFIAWDSLVFFVSTKAECILEDLSSIMQDDSNLIDRFCELVDFFILSEGEGQYLKVYCKNLSLDEAILNASKIVENNIAGITWYAENKDLMLWDDETERCLVKR
jgi:hypothetical protein